MILVYTLVCVLFNVFGLYIAINAGSASITLCVFAMSFLFVIAIVLVKEMGKKAAHVDTQAAIQITDNCQ